MGASSLRYARNPQHKNLQTEYGDGSSRSGARKAQHSKSWPNVDKQDTVRNTVILSDRIAIMHNGGIVQIGAPRQIYDRPRNAFVATFVGRSNLLPGQILNRVQQSANTLIATALGPVLCKAPNTDAGRAPGAALIRPEHVILKKSADHRGNVTANWFRGRIVQLTYLGESTECTVQIGGVAILVRGVSGQFTGADEVDVFFPPEQTSAIVVDNKEPEYPSPAGVS